MSVAIVHHYPGGTKEQYEATRDAVHPDEGLPAGQTHHFAGPTEGGWQVVAVWETQADVDAFMNDALMPSLGELGDSGFPTPPQQTTFEVDTAAFG